jgi:glutathione-independent formaldehyde dehydrogenase
MVPYADFPIEIPDKDQAMEKILDLMLTDILPTGFTERLWCEAWFSRIYRRCRPVGLACASSCQLLGAAIVIVGDLNEERLAHARSFVVKLI